MKKWLQRLGSRGGRDAAGEPAPHPTPALKGDDEATAAALARAEQLVAEGNALEAQNLHAQAEARYCEAVRIFPEGSGIRIHLGNLHFGLHRLDEAQACYAQALALNPGSVGARFSLARVAIERAQWPEASGLLDAAIAADPAFAQAWMSLGLVRERLGDWSRALACYGQVIAMRPRDRDALMGLAMAHWNLGRLEDADAAVLALLAVTPHDAEGWNLRGQIDARMGLIPSAIDSLRRSVEFNPGSRDFFSMLLFNLNYLPEMSPAELLREHRLFDERFGATSDGNRNAHAVLSERDRRLNVGYVSGDLREHVVARFLEPLLACHDAERIAVYAYHSQGGGDATTARLKGRVDHWRDISAMVDDTVAELIRNDRIDVLVDLSGHTTHHRLAVFSRKPAPIQATWLGYPNTTGIGAIDYLICDPWTDPPGPSANWAVEQPARMPACQWCIPRMDDLPAVNELPMLERGFVTFGSFNNVAKINERVLDAWAAILREVPASRLIFFRVPARRAEERLAELLGRRGIGRKRFELRGYCGSDRYLHGYHDVDIALDPFPYNGFTTSFDCLAMGVPFIALAGDRLSARGGLSILANMGLRDLAADSAEGYVAVAKALAADPDRLRSLRAGMRARLAQSPLADAARFTRDLEDLYRVWWHRWCDERSPG